MALSTDFRVVSNVSSAALGLPETRLAIIPGAGGTHRLRDVVGKHRALDLILTGRKVKAKEAYELGIATRIVPGREDIDAETDWPAELFSESWSNPLSRPDYLASVPSSIPKSAALDPALLGSIRLAAEILSGGPVAVTVAKRVVSLGLSGEMGAQAEGVAYKVVVGTKDRDEALGAWREKRAAKFLGE